MKRILMKIGTCFAILYSSASVADTSGSFFNVTTGRNMLSVNTTIPHHTYSNAGIKINSLGYTLAEQGTQCVPAGNGYCLFSVSDTQAINLSLAKNSGAKGVLNVNLCLNGSGPLSCQNYSDLSLNSKVAYVANSEGSTVSLCTLNPTNGLISSCQNAGGGSALDGVDPQGIIINNAGTMAYIAEYEDASVAQCPINANGTFGTCVSTPITSPSGFFSYYGKIALNPANTIAYIPQYEATDTVLACPIVNGLISGTCTSTGATGLTGYPTGTALNSAGTTMYVGQYNGSAAALVCSVNGSTFSNCVAKTGSSSITIADVGGVALNNAEDILYLTDYSSGKVYGCSTTANNTSLFNSCFIATSATPDAWGVALNATNTVAYISDYDTTVYQCPILANGTFGSCTSNASFSEPTDIAL